MRPNIGLSESSLASVAEILNTLLADEYMLYTKTRNYHWNVTGPQFNELHRFFEAQYNMLNGIVDEVAERARTLGATALGTLTEFRDRSRLSEQPGECPDAMRMISNLLEDHETIARCLRDDSWRVDESHDIGTSDFLSGLAAQHEKTAWMLRSFLDGPGDSASIAPPFEAVVQP